MNDRDRLINRIRWLLGFFIFGLVISGLTAFALDHELNLLGRMLDIPESAPPESFTGLKFWIAFVRRGLNESYAAYPFIAYGTDWLAFAHLILAILFIGPFRDPVRNIWVINFGLIACALVIPLALIAGSIRGIPVYWQLIDSSFGIIGAIPLGLCRSYTLKIVPACAA